MKISILPAVTLLVFLYAAPALAQETGDLKIRFEYGGDSPATTPVNVTSDKEFCGRMELVDEQLVVNAENKGIKNVIVYVYTRRGGTKLDDYEPANNTVTLANENCRFEPHVVIAQKGDKLRITNPDEVGHNANLSFFNNKAANPMIPAGQEFVVELKESEPGVIPVSCNIHPWMKARLVVFEHPFAAVSDDNGELVIKGLPAGKKIVFQANHEAGSIKNVTIKGENVEWSRARFEVEIKPGMNDLGTVVVAADALSAN